MKILSKNTLCDGGGTKVTEMWVESPDVARNGKPGQFIVLMTSEKGERIPLTIVERDTSKGSIKIIFQEAGLTTKLLGRLNPGDSLYALVGPLGHATEIKNYGKVIVVGGGVGIAEIYPVAKAMKGAGNHVTTILGARSKNLLILEKELKSVSDKFYVTTDDGSYERKGFVTDVLREIAPGAGLVYAVGPIPMMRNVASVTKELNVHTLVSLNALMVDATGMCGCCRVTVGGAVKFSCVDGPEFDGNLVDWDELIKRNKIYDSKEKHICKLGEK
ncbi:MAG: sulfide/dihydroorotate dehydrogenase-like FAD/NAD-binding protein [Candidatus Omnitrophota bacterium]|jgi:ferredoxin--NADP+ reductase